MIFVKFGSKAYCDLVANLYYAYSEIGEYRIMKRFQVDDNTVPVEYVGSESEFENTDLSNLEN